MEHIITALKHATRNDDQEMRYLESQINKKTAELAEITQDLELLMIRKEKFKAHSKAINEFIAKHDVNKD